MRERGLLFPASHMKSACDAVELATPYGATWPSDGRVSGVVPVS